MGVLRFDGQVALITGAGRGLGKAYALLLAERGASVLVNDLGDAVDGTSLAETPAEEVVAAIRSGGGNAVASHASVTDQAETVVSQGLAAFGRLDIVINNAGISGGGLFPDIAVAEWERMIDTHLSATVAVCRAAWPHLARQRGCIVNTASTAALGTVYNAHYSTAKAAILGLTRSLAAEGAAAGLRVNAVMPSAYTRMTAQIPNDALRDFMAEHYPVSQVASFVAWLAHSDTAVSGETFSIGAGRAGRVVFAEGEGALVEQATPESWAGVADRVLSLDGLQVQAGMIEELIWQMSLLGEQGAALADVMRTRIGQGKTAF